MGDLLQHYNYLCLYHYFTDEVDIINSDSDDQSTDGSDGGMVVTTKKLSLMDSL